MSDVDSEVIRRFGILNDQVSPGDAMLYGIPYPGVFVTDEQGVVVAKFFHDTYKKRDSPELLIDAALGRVELSDDAPRATGGRAVGADHRGGARRARHDPSGNPSSARGAVRTGSRSAHLW